MCFLFSPAHNSPVSLLVIITLSGSSPSPLSPLFFSSALHVVLAFLTFENKVWQKHNDANVVIHSAF